MEERKYCVSLNIAVNDLAGLRIHGESARSEDKAIGNDGLVHEIGSRGRGLLGGNRSSRHVVTSNIGGVWLSIDA